MYLHDSDLSSQILSDRLSDEPHEQARQADEAQMRQFLNTIFKRCAGIEGHVVLRAFEHEREGPAAVNVWLPFDRELVPAATSVATDVAQRTGERRAVFAPPVAIFGDMFNDRGVRFSGEANVVCAPAIAVELDERPQESLDTLIKVIGEPTLVIASGGVWEGQPKLHAYWRLGEPATTDEDKAALKDARKMAARLVDGDGTAVALSHPMRWPGSWHTKGEPKLCEIAGGDPTRDVKLKWAVEALDAALRDAGLQVDGRGALARVDRKDFKTEREWGADELDRAADAIPNDDVSWEQWNIVGMSFYDASHGSPDGLEAFIRWSEKSSKGDAGEATRRWKHWSSSPPTDVSAGKLVHLARAADPEFKIARFPVEKYFEPVADLSPLSWPTEPSSCASQPLAWIDPCSWEGCRPRPREWEVEGWIPRGEVTLLYGDGGIGKTLLAHQYATCAATGRSWLGQITQPARVMAFFCEDSADELHRRQIDINASLGVASPDLRSLRLVSRKHSDNLLAAWDNKSSKLVLTELWQQLKRDAIAFDADVLIIDTLADVYGGSEIDRVQVNAFVKTCLGGLATAIGGSVIALGHPSASGKSTGSGTSGSTAWNNAARSRLYLRYPANATKGDYRELEGMKSNYGPKGSMLKLRWHRGAFDLIAGAAPASSKDRDAAAAPTLDDAAENAVVAALIDHPTQQFGDAKNSQYFAPRLLKRLAADTLAAFTEQEVADALARLEGRGGIRFCEVGRKNGRAFKGYLVVPDNLSKTRPQSAGVFE